MDKFGKKDAIKALKAGKPVIVFAGWGQESMTFDDADDAVAALPSWAAEVAVKAPMDLNANMREGGGKKKKSKKKKAGSSSSSSKKKKKKKGKKDSADL